MTTKEIISAIVDASSYSFIDSESQGTTRFCLSMNDEKKETTKNALEYSCTGLKQEHLAQLRREGIITDCTIDDYCLHIRIKDSFLTQKQRKVALDEYKKSLREQAKREAEEAKQKHAEKCVKMHDKLVEMLTKYYKLYKNNPNATELTSDAEQLLIQAH